MYEILYSLFKTNAYAELATVSQIFNAILQTFITDKFVNGDSGRDAAINALVSQLQTHLSTNATQPTQATPPPQNPPTA